MERDNGKGNDGEDTEVVRRLSDAAIRAAFFELTRNASGLMEEPVGSAAGPSGELPEEEVKLLVELLSGTPNAASIAGPSGFV